MEGIIIKSYTISPRKPNSGNRNILDILINNKIYKSYLPGKKGEIILNSKVLIIPKGISDCPGIHYRVIRGTRDLISDTLRKKSRSKYGTKSL